jgi:uncharacterized membrane protein YraQ (UPF0718 family)
MRKEFINMVFNLILYGLAGSLLTVSLVKDKQKTKKALKKAWKAFENIMPQFLAILLLIGLMLSVLTPEMISRVVGSESGLLGMMIAAVIGSITLIPGFVAFPLAAALLDNGAGITQIALFVSTLMMVGIVTIPVEMKYFGKRATLTRNAFAFAMAIVVAVIMGGVLS